MAVEQLEIIEDEVMTDLIGCFNKWHSETVRAGILNSMANYLIAARANVPPTLGEFFFVMNGRSIDEAAEPVQPFITQVFRKLALGFRDGNQMIAFYDDDLLRPSSMGLVVPRPRSTAGGSPQGGVSLTLEWCEPGRLLGEMSVAMASASLFAGARERRISWDMCVLTQSERLCCLDSGLLLVPDSQEPPAPEHVLGTHRIVKRLAKIENPAERERYMQGLRDTEQILRSAVSQTYSE